MDEKIFDELQKLYDNNKIGSLVEEICEYCATNYSAEDDSYEDEIEPPEIVESAYLLFCLQRREQILDEFAIVRKKYPELYTCVNSLHETLLINMDYSALEKKCSKTIADYADGVSESDVLSQVDTSIRTSDNLSEALDKFYKWLHSKSQ